MPLVVPGVTTQSGDKLEEWTNKLTGKKLHDGEEHNETLFAKRELPENHRIIKPGQMTTRDFREDRLNVHTDEEGNVSHVNFG